MFGSKREMPTAEAALPGRSEPVFGVPERHAVLDSPLAGEVPAGLEIAVFGMGCFWGAEQLFWRIDGVWSTAVGYAGGFTPNPTYEEVCTGRTGHAEVVRVVFDPARVSYSELLAAFWENHDPTQGYRQGNDVGTQYRSVVFVTDDTQKERALASRESYGKALAKAGHGSITTEVAALGEFWYAEDYHQQYLYKNPNGYCGIGGTGVTCPVGVGQASE